MTTNFYEYDISEEIEKISSVVVYANERKKKIKKKIKMWNKSYENGTLNLFHTRLEWNS